MLEAKIEVSGESKFLEALAAALEPEMSENSRANYDLEMKSGKLNISIHANDITSFRAITTTITGLMSIVEKTWKVN